MQVSRRVLLILLAGLAVAGAIVFTFMTATEGAHLRLEGKILKVRILPMSGSGASLVIVDFRANNPSDVALVVNSVTLVLEPDSGENAEGRTIPKPDMENVFRYEKVLGPLYNPVLGIRDRIEPHRSVDRTAGARFEVLEPSIAARKGLRLRIEDVDGTVAELTESSLPK